MSDWSKHAAKRFQQKEEAEKQKAERDREVETAQNKKFVIEQEILKKRAPEMWSALCERFEAECRDFNSDVGREIVNCKLRSANTLEISRTDENARATLSFDPTMHSIEVRNLYAGMGDVKRLDIKMGPGTDEPRFFDEQKRLVPDIAPIVQRILEELTA